MIMDRVNESQLLQIEQYRIFSKHLHICNRQNQPHLAEEKMSYFVADNIYGCCLIRGYRVNCIA